MIDNWFYSDPFGGRDLLAQADEERAPRCATGLCVVDLWDEPPREPTRVYRGVEIVHQPGGGYVLWWLPVSGREGRLGVAATVADAKAVVDHALS